MSASGDIYKTVVSTSDAGREDQEQNMCDLLREWVYQFGRQSISLPGVARLCQKSEAMIEAIEFRKKSK